MSTSSIIFPDATIFFKREIQQYMKPRITTGSFRFLREKTEVTNQIYVPAFRGLKTSTKQGNYNFLREGIEEYISKRGRKNKVPNKCPLSAVTVIIRRELKDPALTNEMAQFIPRVATAHESLLQIRYLKQTCLCKSL